MEAFDASPEPFLFKSLFPNDKALNDACETLYREHAMVRSLLDQCGDARLSCNEFKELFVSIFKEHISEPFVLGAVDVLNLIYETQISPESEERIRTVVNTAVIEFSALLDIMFSILTAPKEDNEKYATKTEVIVLAAMFSLLWAEKPSLQWQTVATMFFRLIDPGQDAKSMRVELPDILEFTKEISRVAIRACKGIVAVLCSFDMCYQGELSEEINALFTGLDKDQDGGLSLLELMEPLATAKASAALKHQQLMAADAAELSKAGHLYVILCEWMLQLTDEAREYEEEADLVEVATTPADAFSWSFPQFAYKIHLIKDALLGRLAIQATKNGRVNGDRRVSRTQFLTIAHATIAPVVREAFKTGHEDTPDLSSTEERTIEQIHWSFRIRKSIQNMLKTKALLPLLGSIFDLIDARNTGYLDLEDIINIRVTFKGSGGPPMDERFAALIGLFDENGDGEISREELKHFLAKLLRVIRKLAFLHLDLFLDVLEEGALDRPLAEFWSEMFPRGISSSILHDLSENPEAVNKFGNKIAERSQARVSEGPLRLEESLKKMRDQPIYEKGLDSSDT